MKLTRSHSLRTGALAAYLGVRQTVDDSRGTTMRILFFMGRNRRTVSGVSWKLWKIRRQGRSVTASWGPALLKRRKVVPANTLQSRTWRFWSTTAAEASLTARMASKLKKGYQRR